MEKKYSLKPCPFCGGKAALDHDDVVLASFVRCSNCGAKSFAHSAAYDHSSDLLAIEDWNRRVKEG